MKPKYKQKVKDSDLDLWIYSSSGSVSNYS